MARNQDENELIWNSHRTFWVEIEMVCHNSDFPESSPILKMLEGYRAFTKAGFKVYFQDFSDDQHDEISMAVLTNDPQSIGQIRQISEKVGIKIDEDIRPRRRDENDIRSINLTNFENQASFHDIQRKYYEQLSKRKDTWEIFKKKNNKEE